MPAAVRLVQPSCRGGGTAEQEGTSMGWSVALACASVGDPAKVFRPGLRSDARAAGEFARGLYPAATLVETGDTMLDFAMWPYDDELFVGAYDGALIVCDRRLFCLDDDARRVADTVAAV